MNERPVTFLYITFLTSQKPLYTMMTFLLVEFLVIPLIVAYILSRKRPPQKNDNDDRGDGGWPLSQDPRIDLPPGVFVLPDHFKEPNHWYPTLNVVEHKSAS